MYYFKYDLEDLNQLFIPWKEPEYAEDLSNLEIRKTKLKHSKVMYKYAWVDFWNGVDSDSVGMEDLIGAPNKNMPWKIQVDYDGFQKEVSLKTFREDVENYVSRLRENFHINFDKVLFEASTPIKGNILFKNYIQELFNSNKALNNLNNNKDLHELLRIIAVVHIDNYEETYKILNQNYRDTFSTLIKSYRLGSPEQTGFNNIQKYIEPNKKELFYEIELKLVDRKYLNENINQWLKSEIKSLVLFHIYCRENDLIKPHFRSKNTFLRELEKRYNFETGDQGKPGLWIREKYKYSRNLANSEFYFLDQLLKKG